jgi:ABC-2 type transport system ATP-binding protein
MIDQRAQSSGQINNGTMVQIINLTKQYEQILAVNNLSLNISRGEVFGLLGSNGAGKTTTLQIIAGLLKATVGKVYINGLDVVEHPIKVKAILGYLPESPAVYEQLTGREFLNFIGRLRGLSEPDIKKRVNKMAKLFDLSDRIDSRLSSYSKGMKQKISFAATIIHKPKLVLLDEPTSGLDPRFGRLIKDWIKLYKETDNTIILSSHMIDLVEELCGRILILDKGSIKGFGTVDELNRQAGTDNLEDTFIELTGGPIKADF